MVPSIFSENIFDNFFGDDFFGEHSPLYGKHGKNLMKTDIHEKDGGYELAIDLPGFKKDEINIDIKDGYLSISAQKGLDKDEEDKKGRIIRQERYAGVCSRSFYVGDEHEQSEIGARFENGILSLNIPKKENTKNASVH